MLSNVNESITLLVLELPLEHIPLTRHPQNLFLVVLLFSINWRYPYFTDRQVQTYRWLVHCVLRPSPLGWLWMESTEDSGQANLLVHSSVWSVLDFKVAIHFKNGFLLFFSFLFEWQLMGLEDVRPWGQGEKREPQLLASNWLGLSPIIGTPPNPLSQVSDLPCWKVLS